MHALKRRILTGVSVLAAASGLQLGIAGAAQATCSTSLASCFIGGQLFSPSGFITNADGVYGTMSTNYMDVPFSGGGTGTVIPSGQTVTGHNTRYLQIGTTNTPEFIGIGYTAGCGAPPTSNIDNGCTGSNSTGGVYKKAYVDGIYCGSGCTADSPYTVNFFNAVSAGDTHSYQLQRNYVSGAYAWRTWLDGVQIGGNNSGFKMYQGTVTNASERLKLDKSGRNLALSMTQDHWGDMLYHNFGAASSAPPGTYNLSGPSSDQGFNGGFGGTCSFTALSSNSAKVTGTC